MRLHATVRGRVQGVGFRYSTLQRARQLDLTGWVANRWDGSVETVAEGPRDALEQYLHYLHEGPPAAVVRGVDSSWLAASGEFDGFEVQG